MLNAHAITDESLRHDLEPGQPLSVRMMAMHHIGKIARRTPERVALLERVLEHDPDPVIRHDAAFAIGAIFAGEAQDALARAALEDQSILVRHESLESLSFFAPGPLALAAIERGLHDEHSAVRESAEVARAYQAAVPFTARRESLLDPSAPVYERWAASFQLMDDHVAAPSDAAREIFARVLVSDPSPFMRHVAAFMLEEVGGTAARHLLVRAAFEDSSVLVRHEATETLGFMPPFPETIDAVRRLTFDPVPEVALTACIAWEILQTRIGGAAPATQAIGSN